MIKDITFLERIQRRATKFILNDFSADYKTRLISLNLLPLMFLYELFDVFVKCLKFPDPSFVVKEFISFSTSSTRSGSAAKLVHKFSSTSSSLHSYFCRIVRIWNSLPPIVLTLSFLSIKQQIKQYFGSIFYHSLTLLCPVPSMLFVLVLNVAIYLLALNFPLSFSFFGF